VSAAFDYLNAEDTLDIRAAVRAPTGLETLGTYAEELGPDAAYIDPLEMFVEEDDVEGADRAAIQRKDTSSSEAVSVRSLDAAPLAELLHALDTLIDEAELSRLFGAAHILRHTRYSLEYGRETPEVSAAALRGIEASYRQSIEVMGYGAGHPVVETAGFYGRAAAVIEHAPCDQCGGGNPGCVLCGGAGWTPASIESAIARDDERRRDVAIMHAAHMAGIEVGVGLASGGYCPWARRGDLYENHGPFEDRAEAESYLPRLIAKWFPEVSPGASTGCPACGEADCDGGCGNPEADQGGA
jgi:hypothetical protein